MCIRDSLIPCVLQSLVDQRAYCIVASTSHAAQVLDQPSEWHVVGYVGQIRHALCQSWIRSNVGDEPTTQPQHIVFQVTTRLLCECYRIVRRQEVVWAVTHGLNVSSTSFLAPCRLTVPSLFCDSLGLPPFAFAAAAALAAPSAPSGFTSAPPVSYT